MSDMHWNNEIGAVSLREVMSVDICLSKTFFYVWVGSGRKNDTAFLSIRSFFFTISFFPNVFITDNFKNVHLPLLLIENVKLSKHLWKKHLQ